MFWLHEHNRVWRVPILVLILMALIGPWAFDRVNVPSHYPCSAPSVRLEGDFCGLPLSGVLILSFMVIGLVWTTAELVAGAVTFIEWVRFFLFAVGIILLLVLPFTATLLALLDGNGRRRRVFPAAAWGLGALVFLLLVLLYGFSFSGCTGSSGGYGSTADYLPPP
jgi:hypothetical protein